jgi:hypothetical protein
MWTDKAHAGNKFHLGTPIFCSAKKITRTGPENRTDARWMRLGDVFPMGWLPVF